MFEKLQELYNGISGREDIKLDPQMKLKDLELSSLGLVQLICAIEDEFDIEISNKDLKSFKSVKNVVDYLEKLMG
ncbi:MAG: acyl carrier protein [Clostridia bacterium]|nr:acyl carrier protein [Clostridia bacterium]